MRDDKHSASHEGEDECVWTAHRMQAYGCQLSPSVCLCVITVVVSIQPIWLSFTGSGTRMPHGVIVKIYLTSK